MREDALEALAVVLFGHCRPAALELAKERLDTLELLGFTVYKKKVFQNGRRPNTSPPMTDELAQRIRATYRNNPHLTMHEIAALHGVNHGRVSEALARS